MANGIVVVVGRLSKIKIAPLLIWPNLPWEAETQDFVEIMFENWRLGDPPLREIDFMVPWMHLGELVRSNSSQAIVFKGLTVLRG